MLVPLSWLKEYVDITLKPGELGERLTEVGLGTEKIIEESNDVIFDLEITPNRPDLLSIIGIAREIAAIENKKIKYPVLKTNLKPKKILPLTIKTDPEINPRFTSIIIDGVRVKESPKWLKERLIKIGQRPINNIVDITNYVMFELGNPIHSFDYEKIKGNLMKVELAKAASNAAKGGEAFESVDGITYHIPKNAVIIRDLERIIDLCGIKGGKNTGTFEKTKTIVVRVPVEVPILIRRTSQHLGLRSEASSIFERGVNTGGTIDALKRCTDLILEIAGGEIASELYDIKKNEFKPWKVKLSPERLNKILGIEIPLKKVTGILNSLNLSPVILSEAKDPNTIICTIPTYRNDLKIEEDIVEEVARHYGYNNFPKTLPQGQIPTVQIPYFKDYKIEEKVKNLLTGAGFSEVYTYSLVSESDLSEAEIKPENVLRVDNPVSREFEYLRPTLKLNLIKALRQNKPFFNQVNLFELGKVYLGKTLDKASEKYFLSGISNTKDFYQIKGILERIYKELGIKEDPTDSIEVTKNGVLFEINYSELLEKANPKKTYKPIPKYPAAVEDLAIIAGQNVKTGSIIEEIKKTNSLIKEVTLLDQYENTRTFHIVYQHMERNLTSNEISEIREKILKSLKSKFNADLKS